MLALTIPSYRHVPWMRFLVAWAFEKNLTIRSRELKITNVILQEFLEHSFVVSAVRVLLLRLVCSTSYNGQEKMLTLEHPKSHHVPWMFLLVLIEFEQKLTVRSRYFWIPLGIWTEFLEQTFGEISALRVLLFRPVLLYELYRKKLARTQNIWIFMFLHKTILFWTPKECECRK